MLRSLRTLHKLGVMGINERNVNYVNAFNPRKYLVRVNDKVATKSLAEAADIPTPELYGVVANARDMGALDNMINRRDGFVIKPAQGSQGKGIIVIDAPLRDAWRSTSGRRVTRDVLRFQINNIISGMYSLGGQPDKAMIEYRVKFDDIFNAISFKGVPDIRVIVLRGVPVFAMLRLPTAESDGKANLHKGGVGVGVHLATGVTMRAMQYDRLIDIHPDTANILEGVQTPHWREILLMAARSYDITQLGYIGVDIVLDKELGPLLLELNARPGISIQIANRCGMKQMLDKAAALDTSTMTASERVEAAIALAGGPPSTPGMQRDLRIVPAAAE